MTRLALDPAPPVAIARPPSRGKLRTDAVVPVVGPRHVVFWREATLLTGLFLFYKFARFTVRSRAAEAFANAAHVRRIEDDLGLHNELSLQQLALKSRVVVRFLNEYYITAHLAVAAFFLLWIFWAHPEAYPTMRRMLVSMTAAGLVLHVMFPLAPPRMFPSLGFIDTGVLVGPSAYGHTGVYKGIANQFAAMPSLHFGWALLVTWGLAGYTSRRIRWLGLAHSALTLFVIVATANHYWLDAIVAAGLFAVSLGIETHFQPRPPVG